MHGIKSPVSAIAVHPKKSLLAIAGADGFILLWDYLKKSDPIQNFVHFQENKGTDFKYFTAIEFASEGDEILVAQHNGEIKVMDSETVKFRSLSTPLKLSERHNKSYATQMVVTDDGKYFAVCDNNCSVSLFKKDHL